MATKAKPPGTTLAVKAPSGNIISIQDTLRAQAALMGERTAPAGGSQIRITQDKFFVLPDGTKTQGPLDLVIVDFGSFNRYYESGFDSKNITPPVCFALGSNPKALVPSSNAPEVQATECNLCLKNQYESNPNGKGGKACDNRRVMIVLPPDGDENTPLWRLEASAMAVKGFDNFVTSTARVFASPPVGVVVSVGFNPNETYANLVFTNPQPNPNVVAHFGRQAEAQAMLAVEPDVSKYVAKPARGKVAARR